MRRLLIFMRIYVHVYSFEFRKVFWSLFKPNVKYYIIENTTKKEIIKIYLDVWNAESWNTIHDRIRYILRNHDVVINVYRLEKGKQVFISGYSEFFNQRIKKSE